MQARGENWHFLICLKIGTHNTNVSVWLLSIELLYIFYILNQRNDTVNVSIFLISLLLVYRKLTSFCLITYLLLDKIYTVCSRSKVCKYFKRQPVKLPMKLRITTLSRRCAFNKAQNCWKRWRNKENKFTIHSFLRYMRLYNLAIANYSDRSWTLVFFLFSLPSLKL